MTFRIRNGSQPTIEIREGSDLRYGIDVAGILAPGDIVDSVTVEASHGTVSGAGVDGTKVAARLSGVIVGQTVEMKFTWTTEQGDTDSRTLWLPVIAQ